MHADVTNDWAVRFAAIGAFWKHDGHPARPNVTLTTPTEDGRRRLSNGYFNGHVVQRHPGLFAEACHELFSRATPFFFPMRRHGDPPACVVGAEKGGIGLALRIGEYARMEVAYAEKNAGTLVFARFSFLPRTPLLLVEDTIVKGGTLLELKAAAIAATPQGAHFAVPILALCNRSGRRYIDGHPIIALVDAQMDEWVEGENPATPNGKELVPPVSGKTHWAELTRSYD